MQGALDWLRANPALSVLFAYLLTGVLTALFKPRTSEEYARMPKWVANGLKFLAAIGLDPVKVVEVLVATLRLPAPGDGSGDARPSRTTSDFVQAPGDPAALRAFAAEMAKKNPENPEGGPTGQG
jgi:hypothetical protein